jgi:hypothetical protein
MARKYKQVKGKHLQHTDKFYNELNSVKVKKLDAFRFYDETWLIGKYKGTRLNDTPTSYIRWAVDNMKLSETALSILKSKLI